MSESPAPPPAGPGLPAADGRRIRDLLHDVNNHLGVVVAHLDLMTARDDLPRDLHASVRESLEACVAAIERLRDLQAMARGADR